MNPLLTLRTLATDVEHAIGKVTDDEGCFGDTSGLDTGAKDVLVVREIVWGGNSANGVKVAR